MSPTDATAGRPVRSLSARTPGAQRSAGGLWLRLRTGAITAVEHTHLTVDFDRAATDDHMAHPSRYRDGNTDGGEQS